MLFGKCRRALPKTIGGKQATKCWGNATKTLRGETNEADMLTREQTAEFYETGIMYREKIASVGTVAKGIHIREENLPILLMENIFLKI